MDEPKRAIHPAYISAQEAAEISGYSRDYIARLCRNEKIRARRSGNQWFVSNVSLHDFLIINEYDRSKRRESLASQRKNEYLQTPITEVAQNWKSAAEGVLMSGIHDRKSSSNPISTTLENLLNAPSGATHAALQVAHVPPASIGLFIDVAHRLVALLCTVLVIFGAYTLVNPDGSLQFVKGTIALSSSSIANVSPALITSTIGNGMTAAAATVVSTENLEAILFKKLIK